MKELIIVTKMRNLFTEFPLHIRGLYGSTPYPQKYETVVQVSVKLGMIKVDLQNRMQRFISQ